jgi:hypothetical protein
MMLTSLLITLQSFMVLAALLRMHLASFWRMRRMHARYRTRGADSTHAMSRQTGCSCANSYSCANSCGANSYPASCADPANSTDPADSYPANSTNPANSHPANSTNPANPTTSANATNPANPATSANATDSADTTNSADAAPNTSNASTHLRVQRAGRGDQQCR